MGIRINHLSAGYGKSALPSEDVIHDIAFNVEEGRSVCILGENGSGKSTLLKVLAGLLDYRGNLQIDGKEQKEMKRRELSASMAFMSQFSSVYFSYTVWETVMLGRYLKMKGFLGRPTKEDEENVRESLERTGLLSLKDTSIHELSGGQIQRVFLARAFAQETPYLLLDEPTNHLDLKYQAGLAKYLQEWVGKERTYGDGAVHKNTLIGVFHDINLALHIADDLVVMKDGKILASGSREEILSSHILNEAYGLDVEEYMQKQSEIWKEKS